MAFRISWGAWEVFLGEILNAFWIKVELEKFVRQKASESFEWAKKLSKEWDILWSKKSFQRFLKALKKFKKRAFVEKFPEKLLKVKFLEK